jgi:hypothetical protein
MIELDTLIYIYISAYGAKRFRRQMPIHGLR